MYVIVIRKTHLGALFLIITYGRIFFDAYYGGQNLGALILIFDCPETI
jgi:hypothetical protein